MLKFMSKEGSPLIFVKELLQNWPHLQNTVKRCYFFAWLNGTPFHSVQNASFSEIVNKIVVFII